MENSEKNDTTPSLQEENQVSTSQPSIPDSENEPADQDIPGETDSPELPEIDPSETVSAPSPSLFACPQGLRELINYHQAPALKAYTPKESLNNLWNFWRRPVMLGQLVLFLLLVGVFVIQASIHWVAVIDDSYITFRFVDMFVKGHGWRFSPLGPKVEGFTNFLWANLLVIPHWLGWDLMFVSKIFGMISGVLAMAAGWGFARTLRGRDDLFNLIAPALLATNAHFSNWGQMGLETLLQCALITATYWRFESERRDSQQWQISPLLAILAGMTRIDSLYYLAPIGLYGGWMVLTQGIALRRMIRWSLLAAIPFLIFWVWKWNYFGDFLPNTYYAKQRHVLNEGHERGKIQLKVFYFDQAGYNKTEPMPWNRIQEGTSYPTARRIERLLWNLTFAKYNSWAWLNLWSMGALFTLLSALTPWLKKREKGEKFSLWSFLKKTHWPAAILILIILPWLMNLYYVYHVNGDWMPCFRFFQVVLPFIGVAVAIGFGFIATQAWSLLRPLPLKILGYGGVLCFTSYLFLGTAYEQLNIHSVSIYGPGSEYWGGRPAFWYLPGKVKENYAKGFSPPLAPVSDYLLLETQDDGWIFMSDIGQPLWFAEHLNLYDVDGLVDPLLGHAPSKRGNIPKPKQIYKELIMGQGDSVGTKEGKPLKQKTAQNEFLWKQAQKMEFNQFIERNAKIIMEQRSPEYLLIFLNHPKPDPKSKGYPYPEISREVYNHPNMKNYEENTTIPKIGNVYNHIFRRNDIERQVPDEVKIKRLYRAIKRNPRMPYLVGLLYKESRSMDISQEEKDKITQIAVETMDKWSADPVVADIARYARLAGDHEIALKGLLQAIEKSPNNSSNYYQLANLYQKDKEWGKAAETYWEIDNRSGESNNSALYSIIWLKEQIGDIDGATQVAKIALERNPKDSRAWSDFASMLERASRNPNLSVPERLKLKSEALEAFLGMSDAIGRTPDHIQQIIDRLRNDLQRASSIEKPTDPPIIKEGAPQGIGHIPNQTRVHTQKTELEDKETSPSIKQETPINE